jgi:hypothetical protein
MRPSSGRKQTRMNDEKGNAAYGFHVVGKAAADLAGSMPGIMDRVAETLRPACDSEKWGLCMLQYGEMVSKYGRVTVFVSLYDSLAMMILAELQQSGTLKPPSKRPSWREWLLRKVKARPPRPPRPPSSHTVTVPLAHRNDWPKKSVVEKLELAASRGTLNDRRYWAGDDVMDLAAIMSYVESCTEFHAPSGTFVVFTRDTVVLEPPRGVERCLHLSLSFREPYRILEPRSLDRTLVAEWVRLFFGDDRSLVWVGPPVLARGKVLDVHHYRLFCDEHWQPISSQDSTELTERGYKRYSELHPEDKPRMIV